MNLIKLDQNTTAQNVTQYAGISKSNLLFRVELSIKDGALTMYKSIKELREAIKDFLDKGDATDGTQFYRGVALLHEDTRESSIIALGEIKYFKETGGVNSVQIQDYAITGELTDISNNAIISTDKIKEVEAEVLASFATLENILDITTENFVSYYIAGSQNAKTITEEDVDILFDDPKFKSLLEKNPIFGNCTSEKLKADLKFATLVKKVYDEGLQSNS